MTKAIQQIMLGTVMKNEAEAAETLKRVKAAGYDAIELNGFMIKPTSCPHTHEGSRNAGRKGR